MNILSQQLPFIKGFCLAVLFSISLLVIRDIGAGSPFFTFLIWNLFLACIPYAITTLLSFRSIGENRFLFLIGFMLWLAFIPNAPYILTDLQHIRLSNRQFIWFDVLLILSFAINGLIIGFVSLRSMQKLLQTWFSKRTVTILIHSILLLCGFGIYLGRVLRWNSWDILKHPLDILGDIFQRFLFPLRHMDTWGFTLGFGCFLIITYHLIQFYQKDTI